MLNKLLNGLFISLPYLLILRSVQNYTCLPTNTCNFLDPQYLNAIIPTRTNSRNRVEHRSADEPELIQLPFYGGARGQVLQIKRNPDGSVLSEVVSQATISATHLPSKNERADMSTFQQNLLEIQRAASQLVTLQQNIKLSGRLTDVDRRLYSENLERLGVSAQNLAHIQQQGGQDDFRLLFEGPLFGDGSSSRRDEDENGEQGLDAEVVEEESVGEETSDTTSQKPQKPSKPGNGNGTDDNNGDSVQVSVPDKDAAVAEAKPVGKLKEETHFVELFI